jgi:hypothetical protein
MTRAFAIRLDAKKFATVARLAKRRGATVSEVVREALDGWIERVRTDGRSTPYVAVADLVGTVDSQRRREARRLAEATRSGRATKTASKARAAKRNGRRR